MAAEKQEFLKIWRVTKHDEFDYIYIEFGKSAEARVRKIVREGGFWYDQIFTPFHSISSIEISEGE